MATRGRIRKSAAEPGDTDLDGADMRLRDHPRADRENAQKLHGLALRELGRLTGIPRSSMERMDDDKLRRQIGIAQSNQLDALNEVV